MTVLFGDTTGSLEARQHGGAQTLVGSDPTNTLFGDAGLDCSATRSAATTPC